MQCSDILDRLDEYRECSLAAAETDMVAAHLAECADCSAALDADEMLGGLLRNAETPSPAASYFDALPARIRTRLENDRVRSIEVASAPAAGSHRILRRWLEVAAAFVIGAGAMAVFNSLPEPGSVRRGRFSAGADAPETVALATAVESYQVDERAAMAAVPKGAAKLDATALAAPATSSLRDVVNAPPLAVPASVAPGPPAAPASAGGVDSKRKQAKVEESALGQRIGGRAETVSTGDVVPFDSLSAQGRPENASRAVGTEEQGASPATPVVAAAGPASAPIGAVDAAHADAPGLPARKMILGGLSNFAGTDKDQSSPLDNRFHSAALHRIAEDGAVKGPTAGIPVQALAKSAEQDQTQWHAARMQAAELGGRPAPAGSPVHAGTSYYPSLETTEGIEAKARAVNGQAFGGSQAADPSSQWALLMDAEDAALSGQLALALSVLERVARANPDSRIALRAQVRIGEIAQEELKDTARARTAFEACLAPPLSRHLSPDLKREIERRLAELPQPR